ncbi:hypothetical protein BDY17DRAFT_317881 [Neohortaea acidophila]|uniref:Tim17/Tim22/Tim23/Pmp24 family-domain-containing protein n=1 Tax=Neohortaea acidophila TaxID=245834 RepID=A0A6A6PP05_9PEZI|nr:uncharacterized protein BDY17DRAFT_317881 [Neohortaea acidophila]KAF2481173.1 hypothetical protein BDY17DRAFT_317881 [Neohortaea acidophila]
MEEPSAAQPITAEEAVAALLQPAPGSFHRISQPFIFRLPIYMTLAGVSGFFLGARKGGQEAGLRFRAEHAHRLPNTQAGWYLYHKSKNYHIALGGIYEGFRMGGRLAPWAGCLAEEVRGRAAAGNKDFLSTMLAGLVSAGLFSAWKRMPLPTGVRLMKLGAKGGFAFGLLQDAVNLLQGRRLGYVEFIKKHTIGTRAEERAAIAPAG